MDIRNFFALFGVIGKHRIPWGGYWFENSPIRKMAISGTILFLAETIHCRRYAGVERIKLADRAKVAPGTAETG